jgi:hypothetical protein
MKPVRSSPDSAEKGLGFRSAVRRHEENESAADAVLKPGCLVGQVGPNLIAGQFCAELRLDDR